MADDDRIIIASRNLRTELLPVLGFKVFFRRDQDIGPRIQMEVFGSPLFCKVVGDHDQALLAEALRHSPRRFISCTEAVISYVFPAPTQWASNELPPPMMRATAST